MKIDELREVVGRVTISFAVNPETKYLLQLGAKKAGVTFSEYCRQVIEGNLPPKEKEKKEEKEIPVPGETKKEHKIHLCEGKGSFKEYMLGLGYKKSLENEVVGIGSEKTYSFIKNGEDKKYRVIRRSRSEWSIQEID